MRWRHRALAALLPVCSLSAEAQRLPDDTPTRISRALMDWAPKGEDFSAMRFTMDTVDLDGDDKAEVLVYLNSEGWCGSGGCNLLLLTEGPCGLRPVSADVYTLKLPVYLLDSAHNGWRDLAWDSSDTGSVDRYAGHPAHLWAWQYEDGAYAANDDARIDVKTKRRKLSGLNGPARRLDVKAPPAPAGCKAR